MSDQRPIVDISGLEVAFASDRGAVRAVAGVSLRVERGEVLAIVGESGSGKTVTAKTILGLLPETATASGVAKSLSMAALKRAAQGSLQSTCTGTRATPSSAVYRRRKALRASSRCTSL